MTERFLNAEFLREFIDVYRCSTCLWQVKSPDYSNRTKRKSAYERLVQLCKKIDPHADIEFVKNKIRNVRTVFRRELQKVNASKKCNDDSIYIPKLWYYDLLSFISEQETQDEWVLTEEHEEINEFEPKYDCTQDNFPQVHAIDSAENISLTTNRSKRSRQHSDIDELAAHSTKRFSINDEFDAIGITVAAKLRRMDDQQRFIAELIINKVIYNGLTNKLGEDALTYFN